ncbi:hypothetical protein CYMTET_48834 [Cymbomonas tetramitiformis]|uniref:Uncharacterized protein n=1 Tax=Cymbomonas tetramitiformis TaxID=36881 RepID=A0AAE0BSP4_9CHLO|nr:hypothetical protein CYMTET_48834 [Cymbomonas tetramitiformis]
MLPCGIQSSSTDDDCTILSPPEVVLQLPTWERAALRVLQVAGRFSCSLEVNRLLSVPREFENAGYAFYKGELASALQLLGALRMRALPFVLMLPAMPLYREENRRRISIVIAPFFTLPFMYYIFCDTASHQSSHHGNDIHYYPSIDHALALRTPPEGTLLHILSYPLFVTILGVTHAVLIAAWLHEEKLTKTNYLDLGLLEAPRAELFVACYKVAPAVVLCLWLKDVLNHSVHELYVHFYGCDAPYFAFVGWFHLALASGYVTNEIRIHLRCACASGRPLVRLEAAANSVESPRSSSKLYGIDGVRATHPILCAVAIFSYYFWFSSTFNKEKHWFTECGCTETGYFFLMMLQCIPLILPLLWVFCVVMSVTDRSRYEACPYAPTVMAPRPYNLHSLFLSLTSWFSVACLMLTSMLVSLISSVYFTAVLKGRNHRITVLASSWVVLSITGSLVTAWSMFGRAYPAYKYLPCDDSFRVTIILKIVLLLVKSALLHKAVNFQGATNTFLTALLEISYIASLGVTAVVTIACQGWVAWRSPELMYRIHKPNLFLATYCINFLVSKGMAMHLLWVVSSLEQHVEQYKIVTIAYYPSLCLLVYLNNEASKFIDGTIEYARMKNTILNEQLTLEAPLLAASTEPAARVAGGRPGLNRRPDGLKSVIIYCLVGQVAGFMFLLSTVMASQNIRINAAQVCLFFTSVSSVACIACYTAIS